MKPKYVVIADAILNDQFTLQGITATQKRLPNGRYDWNWCGPNNDPEWAWFFNRHGWFNPLWRSTKRTKDPKYKLKIYEALEDWIESNPPPRGSSFSAAWRPLEAARRLLYVWLPQLDKWQNDKRCSEQLLRSINQSLIDHGHYLHKHHALHGNHLITEMLALVKLTAQCPTLPQADKWSAYARQKLENEYHKQVYPDGAHKELSAHYHRIVTQNYTTALEMFRQAKLEDEVKKWTPRIQRMWQYLAAITKTNGKSPVNNDADLEDFSEFLKTQNFVPPTQEPVSVHFPDAGHTIFRGNQQPHWAFFDTGPRGTDHQHDDYLNFCLSIAEDDFLIDCGRYAYAPGKWRDYFTGPAAHNIVLINGTASDQGPNSLQTPEENSQPRLHINKSSGHAIFAHKANRRSADWTRSITYQPDQKWTLQDQVHCFGSNELTTLWHIHPTIDISGDLFSQGGLQLKGQTTQIRMSLQTEATPESIKIISGQENPQIQGWLSETFHKKVPCPTIIITQRIKRPTLNTWTFAAEAPKP